MHCAGWQPAVSIELTDRGSDSHRKEVTMLRSALTGGILLLAYSIVFTMMCVVATLWGMMTPIRWGERTWGGKRPLQ
jgi:hypothetical protein